MAAQDSGLRGIRAPEPAGPSPAPGCRLWGSDRRDPQRERGGDGSEAGYIWPVAPSLSRGLGEDGSGSPGGWEGRAWPVGGRGLLGPLAGRAAGQGAGAPGGRSCVCWSGHRNPAPSS